MSLYVRLFTNFWTHRKTMRLRSLLGDDAFWIPPRLWSYAAENQADGDFSKYEPSEMAMLIGYSKDATSMLQALRKSGFLDGMKIHGWDDHNEYHKTFSDRAKAAADARWEKERSKEKTGHERKGKEQALLEHAPSIPSPLAGDEFAKAWEEWAEYRRQAKLKPYTSMGGRKQLTILARLGKARAIAAIENSIANSYQGIFEPKQSSNGNGQHGGSKRIQL